MNIIFKKFLKKKPMKSIPFSCFVGRILRAHRREGARGKLGAHILLSRPEGWLGIKQALGEARGSHGGREEETWGGRKGMQ